MENYQNPVLSQKLKDFVQKNIPNDLQEEILERLTKELDSIAAVYYLLGFNLGRDCAKHVSDVKKNLKNSG